MSLASPTSGNTIKPPQIILSQDPEEEATVSPDTKFTNPQKSTKILAFPPNRETLGGTSYLIVRNGGNILIDCPAWEQIVGNQTYLQKGAVRWLFISHRGAMDKVAQIQQALDCEIVIQEQEAYLLPGLTLTTFSQELSLDDTTQLIWTPGHSPGSSCLYYREFGGILFSGRHLVPNPQAQLAPFRTPTTFHWPRQLKSLTKLCDRFSSDTLQYICPGAHIGFLRGRYILDQGYELLMNGLFNAYQT